MSVESGFKTFRGSDGLWEDYPVEQVATHEALEADPALVINFYNRLRKKLFAAQPNAGHKLIKDLEKNYEVAIVTQNVDDLHERAGSSNVIHLHGELKKMCSSNDPYNPEFIEHSEADIFVIVGTSLNVYPAAGLIHYVRPGKPIYLIDPNEVAQGKRDDITVIRKGASEGLEELMGHLEDIGI